MEIKTYENINPQFFLDVIKPAGQPAVLKGLASHWPAVALGPDALLDHLQSIATKLPIPHFVCVPQHRGRFFYSEDYTSFNY